MLCLVALTKHLDSEPHTIMSNTNGTPKAAQYVMVVGKKDTLAAIAFLKV